MAYVESFPAVAAPVCHTLILGSMPGIASLARQQYYAHPRNAFWPIMTELLGVARDSDYAARTAALAAAGFGLWDVLQACVRPGSLDTSIEPASIVPNDIAAFVAAHSGLRRIACNGGKSSQLLQRHVLPRLDKTTRQLEIIALPSTSPAHAGMPYAEKLQRWSVLMAMPD